jgi:LysR family transcriptional regulator, regulator for bpeEF and oprC
MLQMMVSSRRSTNPGDRDTLLRIVATIGADQLAAFVAVVRAGSFTAAAKTSHTQKAHLSRVVSRLEKQLGVRLLQRSTRSLALTEVGRDLYERATGIIAALEETEAAIQGTLGKPQGVLKLTCAVELGMLVANGWIGDFLRQYPEVRVDAEFSNRVADLIHEGFDLAIRVGHLPASSLSARKLGEVRFMLYAGPDYLRQRGEPAHPSGLAAHDLIMFPVSRPATWRLFNERNWFDVSAPPRFILDNNIIARDAALEGLGITLCHGFSQLVMFVMADLSRFYVDGLARPCQCTQSSPLVVI